MEDNLNGRGPHWKMTSMEDDLNGKQVYLRSLWDFYDTDSLIIISHQ